MIRGGVSMEDTVSFGFFVENDDGSIEVNQDSDSYNYENYGSTPTQEEDQPE